MKLDDTRKVETMLKVQINRLVKETQGKKKAWNYKKYFISFFVQKKGGKQLNAGGGKTGGVDTRAYDGYDDMEDLM